MKLEKNQKLTYQNPYISSPDPSRWQAVPCESECE